MFVVGHLSRGAASHVGHLGVQLTLEVVHVDICDLLLLVLVS